MDVQTIFLGITGINAFTFFMYWHDKRCARKGRMRVPEALLLGLALLGGSPAAFFAMRIFRHKTKKTSFRMRFWLVVALQLAVIAYGLTHYSE